MDGEHGGPRCGHNDDTLCSANEHASIPRKRMQRQKHMITTVMNADKTFTFAMVTGRG